MKYLMLLTNPTERVESWEKLSPDEAQRLRDEEMPKWGAFMQWAQEKGIQLDGLELDTGATTVRKPNGDAAVVTKAYLGLTPNDRAAVFAFLKTLRAPAEARPVESGEKHQLASAR